MDLPSFDAAGLETRDELIGFLTSVLEASTEYSMIVIDRSGLIVLWNEGARRLYGYESGEIIGKPHTVLHTEDDVRAGLPGQMLARVLDHGKFEGTVERRRKDGSRFTARVVETPRRDAHGSLSGFLLISSDITDELRLQSAGRAKDRFLANMSHELRTPLNAILGFTGTLLTGLPGPLNDVQNKQLRTVQTSGRHLLSLINDLLDVARIESGTIDLHVEPIDCGELLSEVAMSSSRLPPRRASGSRFSRRTNP
jgi:PAS domain S-box-containing protein